MYVTQLYLKKISLLAYCAVKELEKHKKLEDFLKNNPDFSKGWEQFMLEKQESMEYELAKKVKKKEKEEKKLKVLDKLTPDQRRILGYKEK